MNADGSFTGQPAPCGQIVDGENYEDHDDEVVVTRETSTSAAVRASAMSITTAA